MAQVDQLRGRNDPQLLHFAAAANRRDIVEMLLEEGYDIDWKDDEGWTALMLAARNGVIDMVTLLLDRGASKEGLFSAAIHVADEPELQPMLQLLISRGFDVNQLHDDEGLSLLHLATCRNRPEFVRFLLANGANPNIQSHVGLTPLHLAPCRNWTPIMELLLAAGANPEAVGGDEGITPLHNATTYAAVESVRLLLATGMNPSIQNADGFTPLYCARFLVMGRPRIGEVVTLLEAAVRAKGTGVVNDDGRLWDC